MNSQWLLPLAAKPARHKDADITLVCFSFAGGGETAFRPWAQRLPEWIDPVCVQLPGRGRRMAEPLIDQIDRLLPRLIEGLAPCLGKRIAVFGYSLGGLLAFEWIRALRRAGQDLPACMVVAAARAPQLPPRSVIHRLSPGEFQQAMRNYGGIPAQILAEPEMMALVEPILRADFTLSETHTHVGEAPLDLPIVAIAGRSDPIVPVADMQGWQAQTMAEFRLHVVHGNHFFLDATTPYVLETIDAIRRR